MSRICQYCRYVWNVSPIDEIQNEMKRTRSFPRLNSLPKEIVQLNGMKMERSIVCWMKVVGVVWKDDCDYAGEKVDFYWHYHQVINKRNTFRYLILK